MQLNEIHDNHEHASTSLKVILLVFALVLVGTLGYLVWDFNRTPDTTDYSTPVAKKKTETTTTADETADWKNYTNREQGFSVNYPNKLTDDERTWVTNIYKSEGLEFGIGFTPYYPHDVAWSINIFNEESGKLETLIKDIGAQFSDRLEKRENITVNGKSAILVTVTTEKVNNWVSRTVFIVSNGKIYSISNGAISNNIYNTAFDIHYKSFMLLK